MTSQTLLQILGGLAPVVVSAVWAWRIYAAGLAGRYRFLYALLCWFVVSYVVMGSLVQVTGRGGVYRYAWLTADAMQWVLWVCVLLEAATLTLESYGGFVRLGQKLLHACLFASGVAVVGLWTLVPPEMVGSLFRFWRFQSYVVYGSLSTACIIFAVFAAYFRLAPHHNVKIIYGVVSGVLIGNVVSGAITQSPALFHLNVALHFFVLLAGAIAFSPAKENQPARPAPSTASGTAAVQQLEQMNQTLLRLLKR